jgi:tetratricopeptide repeat protein
MERIKIQWLPHGLFSFHQIQRLKCLAADYLSFMSCVDPRDIPLSLLPPDSSQVKQQNALGLLKAYSFIAGQADDQTLSLHRLVYLATRNWLQTRGMLERLMRTLWWKYLSHALFVLQSKEFQNDTQDREYLVQKVAKYLYKDGRYHEAGVLFFRTEEKGLPMMITRCSLLSMAWMESTYRNQGRWTEAEKLFVQVMETFKTVLGPEHPDPLMTMWNLSFTLKGLRAEALSLLQDCVQLQEQRWVPPVLILFLLQPI